MDLLHFPRRRYTAGPTPIEKLERLSARYGGPQIYIKRDDLLGLAGGGNKTRKLEFLLADVLAKGADTVITCGAPQSNHCRLTLSAAMKEGLSCHLMLGQKDIGSYDRAANGNNFLFRLLGVEEIHVLEPGADAAVTMEHLAEDLLEAGRKPYIIPMGGSNEIGALGYVAGALEIAGQIEEQALDIGHIVCTCGSGGTQAGLLAGLKAAGLDIPVIGMGIARPKEMMAAMTLQLAQRTAALLGLAESPTAEDVTVLDDYVGEGYTIPSAEMVEAVKLLARIEGILLDPVYTGKSMAGLLDLLQRGYFGTRDILFLHTGGEPALYAYTDEF